MKKFHNNKVGRPRLADTKLKRESIIVAIIILIIIAIIGYIGFDILTTNYSPKYSVGNVYNTHVNSCVLQSDTISCGPNVTYLKYKVDDNDYVELNKDNKNIFVSLSSYNKVELCYKTNNSELICNK